MIVPPGQIREMYDDLHRPKLEVALPELPTEKPKRSWEDLCALAREARGATDAGRFLIGDMALEASTDYDAHTIAEFAKEIGISSKSAYEYRGMAEYYTPSARAEISDRFPTVTYSHLRVARRAGSLSKALALLEEANAETWSVDAMGVEFAKRGGKTVAQKLYDAIVDASALTSLLGSYEGDVRVVIYEV